MLEKLSWYFVFSNLTS